MNVRRDVPQKRSGSTAAVLALAAGAVLLSAGACSPFETVPEPAYQAVVYGRVTDASGEPVNDANVLPLAHFASCDSTGVSQGVTRTYDGGKYVKRIKDLTSSTVACVTISADLTPHDGTPDTDTTVSTAIRLRLEPPLDSVRVNLQVPARSDP